MSAATLIDAAGLGTYMDSLLRDRTWIKRRVETVSILDERMLERRITLDIDLDALKKFASIPEFNSGKLPIPLAALTKQLQLDLDVRDSEGAAVRVFVSDEDAHASHAYLLAVLLRWKLDFSKIPQEVVDDMYAVVRNSGASRILDDIASQLENNSHDSNVQGSRSLSDEDKDAWQRILTLDKDARVYEVRTLLRELARGYHLMIDASELPSKGGVALLKYRRIDSWHEPEKVVRRPSNRLGFGPLRAQVPAPGIGTAQREHTRIVAPPELTIRAAVPIAGKEEPLPVRDYEARVDPSRSVIYTTNTTSKKSDYRIAVELRPRRGVFLIPAALATATLAIFYWAGWVSEMWWMRLSNRYSSADAAVAIIVVVLSLLVVELVRKGEHRLVSHMLLVPRISAVVAVLAALVAAGGAALNVGHLLLSWMLFGAACVCSVVAIYLIVLAMRIGQAHA